MSLDNINFCGFKTAYLLDASFNAIPEAMTGWDGVSGSPCFMNHFCKHFNFVEGWDLKGTGISGAAGFILEFEVEHFPIEAELVQIENELRKYEVLVNKDYKEWYKENCVPDW